MMLETSNRYDVSYMHIYVWGLFNMFSLAQIDR